MLNIFLCRRIYMIRANPTLVKMVADQVNAERTANVVRTYKILLVPRRVCNFTLHLLQLSDVTQ